MGTFIESIDIIVFSLFALYFLVAILYHYNKEEGKEETKQYHTFTDKNVSAKIYDDGRIEGHINIDTNLGSVKVPLNTSYQKLKEKSDAADAFNRGTVAKYGNKSVIDLGNGMVRVKWSYLDKKYMAVMDDDLSDMYDGETNYIDIPKSTLDKMESRRKKWEKRKRSIERIAEMNNQGMELERRGEIDEAIKMYEKNISYGDCEARHSYDRLMVLYRKRKDYENELRIINAAISMLPDKSKYLERKDKVLTKYLKRTS